MFVLAVKFIAAKGKEEELEKLIRKAIIEVRQNEQNTLMYDLHRKIGDPTELYMYERYTDKEAWKVTHMSQPYIKEMLAQIPAYLEGEAEVSRYEIIEQK